MKPVYQYIARASIILLIGISVFSILLYSISLITNLSLVNAEAIFILSLVISILIEQKLNTSKIIKLDFNLLVTFFICSIPYWFYFADNDNFNSSYHFDYHYGYVKQIINNNIPPSNIYGYGLPTTTYWCYHALIAVLTDLIKIPIEYTFQLINLISIYFVLLISSSLIEHLNPKIRFKVLWILFIPFCINILGAPIFFIKLLLNGLELFTTNIYMNFDYLKLSYEVPAQYSNMLSKFYAFNSYPLGLSYFLFNILLILNHKLSYKKGLFTLLSFSSLVLIHPTANLLPLLFSVCLVLIIIYKEKEQLKSLLFTLDIIIYGLINIIYSVFLLKGRKGFGESNVGLELFNQTSWLSFFHTSLPFVILAIVIYIFHNKPKLNTSFFLMTLIALAASLFISIKIHNQYKFSHEFSILLALIIIQIINSVYKYNILISVGIGMLIILKIGIIEFSFINNFIKKDYTYYSEKGLLKSRDTKESEIIDWLNTNYKENNTIIIIPPATKRITPFTSCSNLNLYARNYWIFTDSKQFKERFENCKIIYNKKDSYIKKNIIKKIQNKYPNRKVIIFSDILNSKELFKDNFKLLKHFDSGMFFELK